MAQTKSAGERVKGRHNRNDVSVLTGFTSKHKQQMFSVSHEDAVNVAEQPVNKHLTPEGFYTRQSF